MSNQNSVTDRVWNVSFIPSSHESSISCSVSFMGSLVVSGWHWNGIWIQQYFDQSWAGKYDARCSCKRPRWFRIIWVGGSMSSLSLMKLFRLLNASNLPLIKLSCQNCAFLSKAGILLLSKRMCLLFPWRLVQFVEFGKYICQVCYKTHLLIIRQELNKVIFSNIHSVVSDLTSQFKEALENLSSWKPVSTCVKEQKVMFSCWLVAHLCKNSFSKWWHFYEIYKGHNTLHSIVQFIA